MEDKTDLLGKPRYVETKEDIQPIFEGFLSSLGNEMKADKERFFPKGINYISFTFKVSELINIEFTIEGVKAEAAF